MEIEYIQHRLNPIIVKELTIISKIVKHFFVNRINATEQLRSISPQMNDISPTPKRNKSWKHRVPSWAKCLTSQGK